MAGIRRITGLLALALATPAVRAQEPGALAGLVDFAQADPVVRRAFQWSWFLDHGFQGADECFAADSVDWPVASRLGVAFARHLETLRTEGDTATLGGHGRAQVVRVGRDDLDITDRKGEHTLGWDEVTLDERVALMRRRKDKDADDQLAVAVLCGLAGDRGNQHRAERELTGTAAAAVGRWLEGVEALATELDAVTHLRQAWSADSADAYRRRVEEAWPEAGSSALGAVVAAAFRARYVEAAAADLAGQKTLAALLHGPHEVTAADENELGVALDYVLAEEAAAGDLVTTPVPEPLVAGFHFLVGWWQVPEAFAEWRRGDGGLWCTGDHLSFLPVPFSHIDELEVTGTVLPDAKEEEFLGSFLSFGFFDDATGHYVLSYDQWRVVENSDQGLRPSGHKDVQTPPGLPIVCRLVWQAGTLIVERDGTNMSVLRNPEVRSGRFFLAGGGHPLWGAVRVVLKGRVSRASLAEETARLAEARAAALFGTAEG